MLRKGGEDNIIALLEYGADLHFFGVDLSRRRTPEQETLDRKGKQVLKILLEKGRGTRSRQQVLQEWLRYSGKSVGHEMVKFAYEEGAEGPVLGSLHRVPGYLMSPLQWAADHNDIEMARGRLKRGECVNGLDVCPTPLQFASCKGNADFVRLLFDHGATEAPYSADHVGGPTESGTF